MNNYLNVTAFKMGADRPFPTQHFPSVIKNFAEVAAKSIVCSESFISTALLATIAVVIGGKKKLKVKAGHTVGTNIVACIIGEPGSRKTPAISAALEPIYRIQKKLRDQSLLRPDDGDQTFTVVTTDATMEALIELLQYTDKLLLLKEEFIGFLLSMNQYRPGDDLPKFLSIISQAPLAVHRKKKPAIFVDNPTLSILGGMQVEVLCSLAKLPNDGLLDRIIWAFPAHIPSKHSDDEIPDSLMNDYCELIEKIYLQNHTETEYFSFSPEAHQVYVQWHKEFCAMENDNDLSPFIRNKLRKLENYMYKFSLILEIVSSAAEERPMVDVSTKSVLASIDLVNFFGAQLFKVGESFVSNKLEKGVNSILAWLKKQPHGMAEVRKILACRVAGVKNKDEATEILEEMKARNLGRFHSVPGSVEGSMKKISFQLHENIWKGGGAHEK